MFVTCDDMPPGSVRPWLAPNDAMHGDHLDHYVRELLSLQAFGATPCYHRRLRRLAAGLLGFADGKSPVWQTVSQRNGLQVRRRKAANYGGDTGAKSHPSRASTVRVCTCVPVDILYDVVIGVLSFDKTRGLLDPLALQRACNCRVHCINKQHGRMPPFSLFVAHSRATLSRCVLVLCTVSSVVCSSSDSQDVHILARVSIVSYKTPLRDYG